MLLVNLGHRLWVILLVLLSFLSAVGGLWAADDGGEFEGVEDVRAFLAGLTLDEAGLAEIDEAVGKLNSESFGERYLAAVFLARRPILPRERMERMVAGGSLDQRLRLRQVFKVNTPEKTNARIVRAMETVMEKKLEGLFPEIVGALEGRDLSASWDACVGACEATATDGNRARVEKALASETSVVRAGAALALVKLEGAGAVGEIEPMVADEDDRIKLIAANFLRERRKPSCLKAYAALLMAEDFQVRWESLDALRQITGEDFQYYASNDAEDRRGPATEWMSWVVENGETADLNFASMAPQEVVLFNGKDLEGWKEVKGFFQQVRNVEQGWGVEDGNLICFGGSVGHLRTKTAYGDYVLRLEYRLPGGEGDSGVGLFLQGKDKVAPKCLEVQIRHGLTGDLYQVGGFKAKGADGIDITFRCERTADPEEKLGDWNRMELRVVAGTVEVSVNGEVVNGASECPEGKTWLTLRNEGQRVEFRELVLVPLD